MKYVIIVICAILFTRIDYLMSLFDRASESLSNRPSESKIEDVATRAVIPVAQDRSFQKTKRETFLALLEVFHTSPSADIRMRAITILKDNPTMFAGQLDKGLESHIFRWREHLNNNEPEVINFLLELSGLLQGENLEIVKRFFSLWMDIKMENFIAAYSRTKDSNCTIATVFGESIPEEEKVNEYQDRLDALNVVLAKEKIDPVHKALATNCALQLNIIIEKLAPKPLPGTATEAVPEDVQPVDSDTQGISP